MRWDLLWLFSALLLLWTLAVWGDLPVRSYTRISRPPGSRVLGRAMLALCAFDPCVSVFRSSRWEEEAYGSWEAKGVGFVGHLPLPVRHQTPCFAHSTSDLFGAPCPNLGVHLCGASAH